MAEHSLHRGLEARLTALGKRIAALRLKMEQVSGAGKVIAFGELQELENRHEFLAERLNALEREGPGFRQNLKAEWEKLADDLTGSLAYFILWVDSHFAADRRPPKKKHG